MLSKSEKKWTAQKSEFRGVVLAAELESKISELYNIDKKNCICLLDSQATLCWLEANIENLIIFHANHVKEFEVKILDLVTLKLARISVIC